MCLEYIFSPVEIVAFELLFGKDDRYSISGWNIYYIYSWVKSLANINIYHTIISIFL